MLKPDHVRSALRKALRSMPEVGSGRSLALLLTGLVMTSSLTGCLMVGGSSRGGFFIFPGGLGLVVIIVIVALLLRRR